MQKPYFGYCAEVIGAEALQQRSKVLFGNRHMLDVCRAVVEGPAKFTALDVAERSKVAYPSVHRTLAAMTSAGLLDRLPDDPGERWRWYQRADLQFWSAALELCEGRASSRPSRSRRDQPVGNAPRRGRGDVETASPERARAKGGGHVPPGDDAGVGSRNRKGKS